MLKICILMPTHCRPENVEEWFSCVAPECNKRGIDIHVYDSSPDNLTEETVAKYSADNVFYHRYVSSDKVPDQKVFDAYKELYRDYDYIWLCGDGILLNIADAYDIILRNPARDAIHFCTEELNIKKAHTGSDGRAYENVLEFVCAFLHSFTLYGATVISSALCGRLVTELNFESFKGSGFFPQLAILSLFERECNFFACVGNFYAESNSKKKGGNGSYKKDGFFPLWVYSWKHTLDLLPPSYDEVREKLYKNESQALFSWGGVALLKRTKNLSLKLIKKYKPELKAVTDCSLSRFYFLAIMPGFIVGMLRGIYKILKKIFKRDRKV